LLANQRAVSQEQVGVKVLELLVLRRRVTFQDVAWS
jgi:hypothetical protein